MDSISLDIDLINPFFNGFVSTTEEDIIYLDRYNYFPIKSPNDRFYEIDENDTLSDISFRAYGDSKYWWLIYDSNNILYDPFILPIGKTIIIPDLEVYKVSA